MRGIPCVDIRCRPRLPDVHSINCRRAKSPSRYQTLDEPIQAPIAALSDPRLTQQISNTPSVDAAGRNDAIVGRDVSASNAAGYTPPATVKHNPFKRRLRLRSCSRAKLGSIEIGDRTSIRRRPCRWRLARRHRHFAFAYFLRKCRRHLIGTQSLASEQRA